MSAESEFGRLVEIMKRLRAPDGCPWDREQTHTSIRDNMVEEVYEAIEAIDSGNSEALKEELGDLSLHVVFHAQIAAESGSYDIEDVLRGINEKLIRRHPHVFADEQAQSASEVKVLWEDIKKQERESKPHKKKGALGGVPKSMPALIYAQEVQGRAKNLGFDWENDLGVLEKLSEEISEVKQATTLEEKQEEFGDLLFTLCNLASRWGFSAEDALKKANNKFYKRFSGMETLAKERGLDLSEMSLIEQDALWGEVKKKEK